MSPLNHSGLRAHLEGVETYAAKGVGTGAKASGLRFTF